MATTRPNSSDLIVGADPGLGASLARALARNVMRVIVAARSRDRLKSTERETDAGLLTCDATDVPTSHHDILLHKKCRKGDGLASGLTAATASLRNADAGHPAKPTRNDGFLKRPFACGAMPSVEDPNWL